MSSVFVLRVVYVLVSTAVYALELDTVLHRTVQSGNSTNCYRRTRAKLTRAIVIDDDDFDCIQPLHAAASEFQATPCGIYILKRF